MLGSLGSFSARSESQFSKIDRSLSENRSKNKGSRISLAFPRARPLGECIPSAALVARRRAPLVVVQSARRKLGRHHLRITRLHLDSLRTGGNTRRPRVTD